MQNEMSVEIDRPIHQVFDFTTNHVTEWSTIVVEDKVIDEKPEGVGTTFHIVTEERGQRMEFDGVVTTHEPPVRSVVFMKGKQFNITADYRFEDLGGTRTRVTQHSTVDGKGFCKVMFTLFGWLMKKSSCKATENELMTLKLLLEKRAAQPSD